MIAKATEVSIEKHILINLEFVVGNINGQTLGRS